MNRIFISHAVADTELAELLVDHLTDAVGVVPDAIFCSSVQGHGVRLTMDFNERMKSTLNESSLVVPLMTPSYLESAFCLMELGAAWSQDIRTLPIVVPPSTFEDVSRTIGLKQGWEIGKASTLAEVRRTVLDALEAPGHPAEYYDRKRRQWETRLPDVLSRLAPGPKVARSELETAWETIGSLEKERADLEEELADFRRQAVAAEARKPVAIILESESLVADDLQNLLEEVGVKVAGKASTERDAVELAIRVRPTIVLSETVLANGGSGLDAVRKIVERTEAIPVFVTAYPERLLSSNRPENAHLVTKPFEPSGLKKTVVEALAAAITGFTILS